MYLSRDSLRIVESLEGRGVQWGPLLFKISFFAGVWLLYSAVSLCLAAE